MHATSFLSGPEKIDTPPIVVLHGGEAHLKQTAREAVCRSVLGDEESDDVGLTRFSGADVEWRTVRDELMTVSMFGERRLIVVDDADEFVTKNRSALEAYADKPSQRSVLILDVKTWRKNTRLAKKLAGTGLDVECTELAGSQLMRWLVDHAREEHGKQLTRDAAALIPELAGAGLTSLDQELAKLAAYVGDRPKIGVDDVRTLVGGWRAETTWKMTDAVRDGSPVVALGALGKLLGAGEAPQRLLGGVNYVFRKYARATELSRRGLPLRAALTKAGVFPRDGDAAERYLRRIGRSRAERILSLLLEADSALKGGSRLADRLLLEQLLLKLSGNIPVS